MLRKGKFTEQNITLKSVWCQCGEGVEVKEMELPTKLMNNDERLWGGDG